MARANYEVNYCTGYILGLSDQLFMAGEVWMEQIIFKLYLGEREKVAASG
jgi:hypothetical protein